MGKVAQENGIQPNRSAAAIAGIAGPQRDDLIFDVGMHSGEDTGYRSGQERRVLKYAFKEHASGPFGDDEVQNCGDRDYMLGAYRGIFGKCRYFGDESFIYRSRIGLVGSKALGRMLRRPLPGWCDTRATRCV